MQAIQQHVILGKLESYMLTMKVLIQMLALVVFVGMSSTSHVLGNKGCLVEKQLLMRLCKETIKKGGAYIHPSETCIDAVRDFDMICICGILTSEDEAEVSIIKIVQLARQCNKSIPSGTKCGSKLESDMLTMKVLIQTLALVVLVSMSSTSHALGNKGCLVEKQLLMRLCKETIKSGGAYIYPSESCVDAVRDFDMICMWYPHLERRSFYCSTSTYAVSTEGASTERP
ncbi:hypothetical protein EJB05_49156, partial [Eragrostis curvula]